MKTASPTKPIIKGERTWADDQGYNTPPHVSPITTDVVDPMTRTFPLQEKVRPGTHNYTNAYMISIFPSFSFRVAGGVLRRKNRWTRVALNAHIGILRSV
jgi:hypothetical protein